MKKIISIVVFASLIFSLLSCNEKRDAYDMLTEFVKAYGAEGIVYSSTVPEGEIGHLPDGMIEKIFIFSGNFPKNFAIFLNSHADFGSECGVFVCNDAEEIAIAGEVSLERIGLLGRGNENAFVKRNGNVVFYSTLQDRQRAEGIWQEIIR